MLGGGLTGSVRKAQELIAELVSCRGGFLVMLHQSWYWRGGTQVTVEVFIVSEEVQ